MPVFFKRLSLISGALLACLSYFFDAIACFKLLCAVQTVATVSVPFVVYDAR